MMNNFLLALLIDPLTREPLVFDSASNSLISAGSKNKYPVIDTIPKILVEESLTIEKSDLHQEFDTKFSYIDHYQKDAELFSYNEDKTPAIIKDELSRLRESILEEISDDMSVILDVGCGGGWASKKLVPLGKKVISMDISSNNPIHAVHAVQHKNHAGLIADAFNIPIKDESINCIIASEIIEHVSDPKKFISGLLRLLTSNGKLVITTPYDEKIEYYLCIHCNKPTPKSAHLHSFNEINFIQYLPSDRIICSSKKFINKYLIKIRSHIILKSIPYKYWKLIDNLFNKLVSKPTRLKVIIKKK
jgi:2-polyprenyl-3-methyl-5-hydroxy-6-metoxy-1,4-benzoquinol methylase